MTESFARNPNGEQADGQPQQLADTRAVVLSMIEQAGITAPQEETQGAVEAITEYVVAASRVPIFDGVILSHNGEFFEAISVVDGEPSGLRETVRASVRMKHGGLTAEDALAVQNRQLFSLSYNLLDMRRVSSRTASTSAVGNLSAAEVVRRLSPNATPLGRLNPVR